VPTTPTLANTPLAPFAFAAAPVGDAPALECDAADDDAGLLAAGVLVAAAGVEPAAGAEVEAAPPRGAVEAASIWAWTVELKVPVMALSVNLAEKASAAYIGFEGSLKLSDSMRIKLWRAN
jgi:hypothetical protein